MATFIGKLQHALHFLAHLSPFSHWICVNQFFNIKHMTQIKNYNFSYQPTFWDQKWPPQSKMVYYLKIWSKYNILR